MIRHRGFFEGNLGSGYPGVETFRLDPNMMKEFFNLHSDDDNSLTYQSFKLWGFSSSSGTLDEKFHRLIKLTALDELDLGSGTTA